MTYVSRKTRIILSGRSDDCGAEFIFQAFRRRSDGRLKNYSSCDDVRAWINDSCVRNEYLQDYMTKNEVKTEEIFRRDPPFALYGRFIPVPILFKILQNGKENDDRKTNENDAENLSKVQQEKNLAEKNLLECTCLLNTAVRKLEKLNTIIETVNSESESARAKEIKEAFRKSREACACHDCKSSSLSSLNNNSDNGYGKKSKDANTYNELMRKISQLKRKLNEVQNCRCEIIHQIRKAERCAPSNQVKELFNREDQNLIKKLQKELEKLIAEKGRLLSEMCHVMNSLNSLKTSRGNSRKGCRSSDGASGGCSRCKCGCKIFETCESSDTDMTDATYVCDERGRRSYDYPYDYSEPPERLAADCGDEEPEKLYKVISPLECDELRKKSSHYRHGSKHLSLNFSSRDLHCTSSHEQSQRLKSPEKRKKEKSKKTKVKFFCENTSCLKKIYHDDLSGYESSLTAEQKEIISQTVKNLQRPNTTPTTKREKRETSFKNESFGQTDRACGNNSLRRAKSETKMEELEKTFKNYERRLNDLDSLEYKVENLKQKSSEVCRLKRTLTKVKAEAKRQRAADREKYSTEITRLCSENWELKKHLQQLTAEFESQCKRIQILKCGVMKARELECETEELKKKLSEYQDGFEHQRKCISKWESVVAVQRTEIENLMNHIRKLTAVNEEPPCPSYQEKKCIQRSRSYSPEVAKEKSRIRRKSKEYRVSSEEEENCCCGEHPSLDGRKKVQLKSLSRSCFSPPNGSIHRYK